VYCVGERVHCEERPSLPDLRVGPGAGSQIGSSGTATASSGAATCGLSQGTGASIRGDVSAGGECSRVGAGPGACPCGPPAMQPGTAGAAEPPPPRSVRFCTQENPPTAGAFGAAAGPPSVLDSACRAFSSEGEHAHERGGDGGAGPGSSGGRACAGHASASGAIACEEHREREPRDGAMRLAASLARALGVGLLGADVILCTGKRRVGPSQGSERADGCARREGCVGACCGDSGCDCGGGYGCSGTGGPARDAEGGTDGGWPGACFSRLMVVDLNYMPNTSLRLGDSGRELAQLVLDRHRAHRQAKGMCEHATLGTQPSWAR
jgi:hypothetical protein